MYGVTVLILFSAMYTTIVERERARSVHTLDWTGRDWTVSTTWLLVALLYRRGDKHRKIVIAG